jgi:hypothetical protein
VVCQLAASLNIIYDLKLFNFFSFYKGLIVISLGLTECQIE